MDRAASAGMAEVALGNIGQETGQSEAVKKFGTRMVEDHARVNQALLRLVGNLKITPPEEPLPEYQKHLKDLTGASPAAFDKAYMWHMVMSHEDAVQLFTGASREVKNEQLRALAAKTLPARREHLKMAKKVRDTLPGK